MTIYSPFQNNIVKSNKGGNPYMSYEYEQQEWKTYDKTLPDNSQQEAIITKKGLTI